MICPIYNKGPQHDPANCRPVRLLSYAKKEVDTAVLSLMLE